MFLDIVTAVVIPHSEPHSHANHFMDSLDTSASCILINVIYNVPSNIGTIHVPIMCEQLTSSTE